MNDWVNVSKNSPCLSIAVLKEFWEKRRKKSLSHWRDCVLCSTERNCREGGGGGAELSWWLEFSSGSQQFPPPSSASLPDYLPSWCPTGMKAATYSKQHSFSSKPNRACLPSCPSERSESSSASRQLLHGNGEIHLNLNYNHWATICWSFTTRQALL